MLGRAIRRAFASQGFKFPMSDPDAHLIPPEIPMPREALATGEEVVESFKQLYTMRRMEQRADALQLPHRLVTDWRLGLSARDERRT